MASDHRGHNSGGEEPHPTSPATDESAPSRRERRSRLLESLRNDAPVLGVMLTLIGGAFSMGTIVGGDKTARDPDPALVKLDDMESDLEEFRTKRTQALKDLVERIDALRGRTEGLLDTEADQIDETNRSIEEIHERLKRFARTALVLCAPPHVQSSDFIADCQATLTTVEVNDRIGMDAKNRVVSHLSGEYYVLPNTGLNREEDQLKGVRFSTNLHPRIVCRVLEVLREHAGTIAFMTWAEPWRGGREVFGVEIGMLKKDARPDRRIAFSDADHSQLCNSAMKRLVPARYWNRLDGIAAAAPSPSKQPSERAP